MKKYFLGIVFSVLSLSAFADDGPYFSVGGGGMTFDDSVDTLNTKQLLVRLGYDFSSYIGIGLESGFSLIADELYGVDYDVSTVFIYLKAGIPFGDGNKLYALVGSSNVEVTGSVNGFSISADDDDTGTGFGLEVGLDDGAFFVDYINYFDDNGVDASSINLGYTARF